MKKAIGSTIIFGILAGALVYAVLSLTGGNSGSVEAQHNDTATAEAHGESVSLSEATANAPFEVLEPAYIPFDVQNSFGANLEQAPGKGAFSQLVLTYVGADTEEYVEVWQRNIEVIPSGKDLELVHLNNGKEAHFLDNGVTTNLRWYDEPTGMSFAVVSGREGNRLPLDELLKVAASLE